MNLNINIKEKKYGSKVILRNVNIDINKGGIIGVVGKNGQGKTTFFKCILGNLKYKGAMIFNNVKLKINDVAWCPTQPLIYDDLTAAEFKKFYAELLKIEGEPKKDLFEIPQNILIKEFSTRAYICPQDSKIATIPIGHADGIGRHFGNGAGFVSMGSKKAPIVGNVCMDMIMVDVTNIGCKEGDEVVFFGPKFSAEASAAAANTISYELITGISQRIKREILGERPINT